MGDVGKGIGNVVGAVTKPVGQLIGGIFNGGQDPQSPVSFYQGPRPDRPAFNSMIGDGDLLRKDLQLTDRGPITQDKQVLNQLRDQALAGPGQSAWEKLALEKQKLDESGLREKAVGTSGQANATARSGLSMRGGLDSGARERLALSGQKDLMGQMQEVGATGAKARADIGLNAENQRQSLMQAMPGMELASIAPDQANRQYSTEVQKYNIDQGINEKRAKDMADLAAYQEQMKAWGAAGTANAMSSAQSGKK